MTRAQMLAQNLRQLVVLFWVLGIVATLGFLAMIVGIFSAAGEDQFIGSLIVPVVWMIATWITLAWMGSLATGVAELLAPSEPPPPA